MRDACIEDTKTEIFESDHPEALFDPQVVEDLSEDELPAEPTIVHRKLVESSVTCDPTEDPSIPPFLLDQEKLFRELIIKHQKRLYRFVIKYIDHPDDAADITQQAFVEAARTIATFRGDSKLSTWLFGIAMNMVRNYLTRAPHRVWKFETDDSLINTPSSWPDPSEFLIQQELLELTEKAFSYLPKEMSKVLGLVAVDEISYQDAADLLSIPLGTVRSRVSRARALLREQFNRDGVVIQF